MEHPMSNILMTQYSAKKRIKLFGQAGADAVLQVLKELHDRAVMVPTDPTTMTHDEKRNTLQYLMFLE